VTKSQVHSFWQAFTPKLVIVWREGQLGRSWRRDALHLSGRQAKIIILRMEQVPYIDSSGASALEAVVRQARREGTQLILCNLREQPGAFLAKLQPAFLGAERAMTFQSALDQVSRQLNTP
jgi:anti-anti-sigma regulatory factor